MLPQYLPQYLSADVPLQPDQDEARDLLIHELSKPEYKTSVSWFDELAQAFWNWISGLQAPGGISGNLLQAVVVVAIIGAIIAAIILFGRPKLNRSSNLIGDFDLFGDKEYRSAKQLRLDAAQAANQAEWELATVLQFRALARALGERTILTVAPGTTSNSFAQLAGTSFPQLSDALFAGAGTFDQVRYLERPGTADDYQQLVQLDRALESQKPAELAQIEQVV